MQPQNYSGIQKLMHDILPSTHGSEVRIRIRASTSPATVVNRDRFFSFLPDECRDGT